jgi:IS5 family transposase
MHKRKRGKKNEPTPELPQVLQDANKAYSKIRARVEHAFATMKECFGFRRLRYRGLERVASKFNSLAIAYNFKRLGFLLKRKPVELQPSCA